jgi:hypothetical protein
MAGTPTTAVNTEHHSKRAFTGLGCDNIHEQRLRVYHRVTDISFQCQRRWWLRIGLCTGEKENAAAKQKQNENQWHLPF